jgi:hypothetical protein
MDTLKKATKDMSWDLRVGYDPKITNQRRVIDKVKKVSAEIDSGNLTKSEIKNKLLELEVLKQQYKTDNRRIITSSQNELAPHNQDLYSVFQPNSLEGFDQKKIKTIQPASSSNAWLSRPGYEPTNEAINQRASSSSYDTTQVGGPDYFKRAQFLCNQIRDAGLGDPKDFGCLNPDVLVSPEYSWKGNYKMVCSRLGNVWGGWYPEMFGCPKTDESIRQTPQEKLIK